MRRWCLLAAAAVIVCGQGCEDRIAWEVDFFGVVIDCEWFATGTRCADSGRKMTDADGTDAFAACCVCGGGAMPMPPVTFSPATPAPTPATSVGDITPLPLLPPIPPAPSTLPVIPVPAERPTPRVIELPTPTPATSAPMSPTAPPLPTSVPAPATKALVVITSAPTEVPDTLTPVTPAPFRNAQNVTATQPKDLVMLSEATEAGVTAVGMAAALGAGAGAASRVVLVAQGCVYHGERPMALPLHPTRLVLSGSQALGAVVGNFAVAVGVTVVAAAGLRVLPLCQSTVLQRGLTFAVRFPSTFLYAFQWLYQGTSLAALTLLLTRAPEAGAGVRAVCGIGALLACVFIPARLFAALREALRARRAGYVDDATRGRWLAVLAGRGEWVSLVRGDLWADRYAIIVRQFRATHPWWGTLEYAGTLAFALSQSFEHHDASGCAKEKFAGALVILVLSAAHVVCLPYHRPWDNILVGAAMGLQVASLAMEGMAYHTENDEPGRAELFGAANGVLSAAIGCVLLQVMGDVATEIILLVSGSRAALQRRVWAEGGGRSALLQDSPMLHLDGCAASPQRGLARSFSETPERAAHGGSSSCSVQSATAAMDLTASLTRGGAASPVDPDSSSPQRLVVPSPSLSDVPPFHNGPAPTCSRSATPFSQPPHHLLAPHGRAVPALNLLDSPVRATPDRRRSEPLPKPTGSPVVPMQRPRARSTIHVHHRSLSPISSVEQFVTTSPAVPPALLSRSAVRLGARMPLTRRQPVAAQPRPDRVVLAKAQAREVDAVAPPSGSGLDDGTADDSVALLGSLQSYSCPFGRAPSAADGAEAYPPSSAPQRPARGAGRTSILRPPHP